MPKNVDVAGKRAEFVNALWRVIRKEGLSAATLRRVAEEADCTTGALTHYFPNRDALLAEALSGAHTAARARLLAIDDKSRASWERLEASVLEALPLDAVRLAEWRTRLAFWGEAVESAALRRQNAHRFSEWSAFLERELAGLIADENARAQEIALLMALVDGFAVRLVLHGDARKKDLTKDIEDAFRAHLASLKARYGCLSAADRAAR